MKRIYASVGREKMNADLCLRALSFTKGRRLSCLRLEECYNLPMAEHRSNPQGVIPSPSACGD